MRNDKVRSLTFSAMFVAVSVVICVLASVFPTMSLAITAVAGIVSAIALIQVGYKYALLVYIASSILVLLLAPNKECAVYYTVFFGHYPMLKIFTERVGKRFFAWVIKIAEANVLYAIIFLVTVYIIGISEVVGKTEFFLTAFLFNAVFVLYDICIGRIMMLYISKRSQNHRFR